MIVMVSTGFHTPIVKHSIPFYGLIQKFHFTKVEKKGGAFIKAHRQP